jgi:hypothetical protein
VQEVGERISCDSTRLTLKCAFPRSMRNWTEYKSWKASEFRDFLLYVGPAVLCDLIPNAYCFNFVHLSCGIYILWHPRLYLRLNDYADSILRTFVRQYFDLYEPGTVTYNIHSLCHLSSDVKHHGTLDSFSAFPFVSYIGKLKRFLKNAVKPDTQICRRLAESRVVATLLDGDDRSSFHLEGSENDNTVLKLCGVKYSLKYPDNICVADGLPCQIVRFVDNGDALNVEVRRFKTTNDLYNFGIPSSSLFIFRCSTDFDSDTTLIPSQSIFFVNVLQ